VPFVALAGAAAVGCLAAVVAAMVPARSAARVPVLAALAGQRPARERTRSWLTLGVVALGLGVGLCWWGGSEGREAAIVGGILLVVMGVSASTGPLLGLVSRLAGVAPLSLRLAARDAGRSRSRAAPATVAAMLALAGAVGGVTMVRSNEAEVAQSYAASLRDDQVMVSIPSDRPPRSAEVAEMVDVSVAAVPGSVGGPVSFAYVLDGEEQVTIQVNGDRGLAVGDLDTLDALGASSARTAFEDGKVVGIGRGTAENDSVMLYRYGDGGPEPTGQQLPAVEVEGPLLSGAPRYLVSHVAAEELGLDVQLSQIMVRAPRPVTDADVRRVNLAALEAGPSVPVFAQREDAPVGLAPLFAGMLGAGALVALFVVALVTALSREELRPHLATLAAVGAGPGTRRRLAAAQSGLLGGMAALLAIPTGLIPAVTLRQSRSSPVLGPAGEFVLAAQPIVVPWLLIATLVVGVTLLSTAGGGLLTRNRARSTG
jgi:putative ABC transport system permease protein